MAADKEKDQSYFLWAVPQEVLAPYTLSYRAPAQTGGHGSWLQSLACLTPAEKTAKAYAF
jgi:hypothetical protein